MTLAAAILAAMTALPCPRDEPAEQCAPWRATVAEAIAAAAGDNDALAADLVEIGYHESGFRKRIQAGDCRLYRNGTGECDHFRGVFLARSMWQIHRTPELPGLEALVPRKRWLAIQGTGAESVTLAARTAARVLRSNPSAFGRAAKTGPRAQASAKILGRILKAQKAAP
jgi:hypothetical protein